jgi:hypothetical protein
VEDYIYGDFMGETRFLDESHRNAQLSSVSTASTKLEQQLTLLKPASWPEAIEKLMQPNLCGCGAKLENVILFLIGVSDWNVLNVSRFLCVSYFMLFLLVV